MDDLQLILTEINGLRTDIRQDFKSVWKAVDNERQCNKLMEIRLENHTGRLSVLETGKKETDTIIQKLDEHVGDKEKHFDKKKAEETNVGYLARKKILLIFLTALAALVSAGTGVAIAWMNGLLGG